MNVNAKCLLPKKNLTPLFTDINMPDGPEGIDGLELARRAVEFRPVCTSSIRPAAGRTDGMVALFVEGGTFLPKPYNRQQLIEAVQSNHGPSEGILS